MFKEAPITFGMSTTISQEFTLWTLPSTIPTPIKKFVKRIKRGTRDFFFSQEERNSAFSTGYNARRKVTRPISTRVI
ncbi:MAG TPA: hypothetical protein VEP90_22265, partial [Methylomirabilota bacterium]|nr:hypothetical protein [Methylomirabilota bacterium]